MPEGYSEDLSIMTTCPYYQKIAKTILNGSPAHLRVCFRSSHALSKCLECSLFNSILLLGGFKRFEDKPEDWTNMSVFFKSCSINCEKGTS